MIDWYSWQTRLSGRTIEMDLDEQLITDLCGLGLAKRRLGRLCLTRAGSDVLRHVYDGHVNKAFHERDRYRVALQRIADCYPGERDYPGELARKALDPVQRLRNDGLI
jgi:hypothetical protein